jgi:hypothetical protein
MAFWNKIMAICFCTLAASAGVYSQDHFEIKSLPFNTNSKELAPAFYKGGLVFCSDRRHDIIMSYTDIHNNPFTNLYFSEQKKPGKFESPRLMSKELTTSLFEGPSAFSKDGKTIYFTRTIDATVGLRNRQREDTTFGIFSADLKDGEWLNLNQFTFNSSEYNTGYPFVSDNGNELYFCSDAPGGYGGYDIYVSQLKNGRWSKAENLGDKINTPENEVFPFLHSSGRLYFASRGHGQRGDLDIYYSIRIGNEWQKPVPLTEPFNSKSDDYGFILNQAADTGYFVSDRKGSADIYSACSTIPTFILCPIQQENDYCYVFYEPNSAEIDTNAFAYQWDLGDGTVIRALEAEHCFARPDTYLVQLNLVDKLTNEVLLAQATYEFEVEQIEQAYILAPDTVPVDESVTFDGQETYLKNFEIDQYYWDYGDGTRESGPETNHQYTYPGTYQLILGVTSGSENRNSPAQKKCVTRKIVVVNPKNN